MIALAKKNIGIWKILFVLLIVCFIFSIGNRNGTDLTYEQHILSAVTDHYYTTYFMLPMVLLCCFTFIEDDAVIVISRFNSYFSYFVKKWVGTVMIAGEIVLFQSTGILLSGIGLTRNDTWLLQEGALEADLFSVLCCYFSTPVKAFLSVVLFELVGIWIMNGLSMWVCHFIGRKWSVRIFMALYVFSALWIKIPIVQSLPVTGLNHLLILHHNLTVLWRFPVTFSTVVLLLLVILLTVKFFWRNNAGRLNGKWHGIKIYYFRELFSKKNIVLMLSCVSGITLYKGLQNSFVTSGEEWMYTLFSGHGTGYFQILPFLETLIVIGTPLYLLAAFVEKEVSEQSLFISIRLKIRRELMYAVLVVGMVFVTFYSVLWGIAGLAGCVCFGYTLTESSIQILIGAICMKGLDIFLQYLLMMVFYICTKQITIGFLVLIVGNLLCILPQNISMFSPFGLSCMMRISYFSFYPGIKPMIAGCGLFIGILLVIGWLLLVGQKKLLN